MPTTRHNRELSLLIFAKFNKSLGWQAAKIEVIL